MTIKKDGETYIASCDECPESIDTGMSDFSTARLMITTKGWRTFKGPDQKWANACRSCVADFAKRQR